MYSKWHMLATRLLTSASSFKRLMAARSCKACAACKSCRTSQNEARSRVSKFFKNWISAVTCSRWHLNLSLSFSATPGRACRFLLLAGTCFKRSRISSSASLCRSSSCNILCDSNFVKSCEGDSTSFDSMRACSHLLRCLSAAASLFSSRTSLKSANWCHLTSCFLAQNENNNSSSFSLARRFLWREISKLFFAASTIVEVSSAVASTPALKTPLSTNFCLSFSGMLSTASSVKRAPFFGRTTVPLSGKFLSKTASVMTAKFFKATH
mmetsp:Transcript_26145/g.73142  ORF Transcript_26145/g.73142 Transcript_26145/m.73142 type:complete len:267 (-) Transcript_26145:1297-2097(-)